MPLWTEVIAQLRAAGLTPDTLALLINDDRKGKQQYALVMGVMGGFCFLAVASLFTYLVMNGHDKVALALLGAQVLIVVKQMIGNRL